MNANRRENKIIMIITWGLLFVIAGTVLWGMAMFSSVPTETTDRCTKTDIEPIGGETLFMASATIMALAVFGSVLGMQIQNRPKNLNLGWVAKLYTALPVLALIIIQSLFMRSLVLCVDIHHTSLMFSPVLWWIFGTMICLMAISFFVLIANAYAFDQKASGS